MEPITSGHLALPASGSGPGILLLHAWWGLNPFFKDLCNRLAAQGFIVFAPDLYQGQLAATVDEAKALRSKLNQKKAHADLLDTIDQLSKMEIVTGPTLALIGFSIGARFALELSTQKPEAVGAVIAFYGTNTLDYSPSRAAYLGHFAGQDEWVAQSGVKKLEKNLRAANRPVTFHTYPSTGHWFFETDQPTYVEPAAHLAWQRTLDFLNLHLLK